MTPVTHRHALGGPVPGTPAPGATAAPGPPVSAGRSPRWTWTIWPCCSSRWCTRPAWTWRRCGSARPGGAGCCGWWFDADGGVSLDKIADVSREVSGRLDTSGVMGEIPYTLEVSSPGIDRPLTEPRHWRRALGRLVSVPLTTTDGNASPGDTTVARPAPTVQGRVLVADAAGVTLDVDGDRAEFDYADLGPGRVQVEFGRVAEDPVDEDVSPAADRAQPGNGSQDGH